ncbi:MAG: hypothetical protein WCS94_03480 [Verrucomicrobiota bacterium]
MALLLALGLGLSETGSIELIPPPDYQPAAATAMKIAERMPRPETGTITREDLTAALAAIKGDFGRMEDKLGRTMEQIGRDLEAVARQQYQLRQESEDLRRLAQKGYLDFALAVTAKDFHAFAVIMVLGNRKAAAEHLKIPARSFYDRVNLWFRGDPEHQRMFRLVEWRKKVGRKILVRLEESMQSGEPNDNPENPETVGDVLDRIATTDRRDYPAILREILDVLQKQNPKNWLVMKGEALEIIQDELQ